MFHFLAVIAFAALLGYAIGCDPAQEVSVMAEVGDAIVIIALPGAHAGGV